MMDILCYDCHNALPREMTYQFQDGGKTNGEVVFTTECPHCGSMNMVIITGAKMQIETTDPDECSDRVIQPIGGGPYVLASESKKSFIRRW